MASPRRHRMDLDHHEDVTVWCQNLSRHRALPGPRSARGNTCEPTVSQQTVIVTPM